MANSTHHRPVFSTILRWRQEHGKQPQQGMHKMEVDRQDTTQETLELKCFVDNQYSNATTMLQEGSQMHQRKYGGGTTMSSVIFPHCNCYPGDTCKYSYIPYHYYVYVFCLRDNFQWNVMTGVLQLLSWSLLRYTNRNNECCLKSRYLLRKWSLGFSTTCSSYMILC